MMAVRWTHFRSVYSALKEICHGGVDRLHAARPAQMPLSETRTEAGYLATPLGVLAALQMRLALSHACRMLQNASWPRCYRICFYCKTSVPLHDLVLEFFLFSPQLLYIKNICIMHVRHVCMYVCLHICTYPQYRYIRYILHIYTYTDTSQLYGFCLWLDLKDPE